MKKFFAIAFIAATMVACNNKADKKETTDTTAVTAPVDTTKPAPVDTTKPATVDTAKKAM